MPHLTLEYSSNLDGEIDLAALCGALHKAVIDTGLFETGAVRVRALRSEAYAIADRRPDNGFVDMTFRIGAGRTPVEKKAAGDAIFAAAEHALAAQLAGEHFALSLEVREIDPELSWKKNSIHPRLRKGKAE